MGRFGIDDAGFEGAWMVLLQGVCKYLERHAVEEYTVAGSRDD